MLSYLSVRNAVRESRETIIVSYCTISSQLIEYLFFISVHHQAICIVIFSEIHKNIPLITQQNIHKNSLDIKNLYKVHCFWLVYTLLI